MHRLRTLAIALLLLTALYNVVEGIIAIISGVRAESLTLVAFGADSYLEVPSSGASPIATRRLVSGRSSGRCASSAGPSSSWPPPWRSRV
jgi:hypothetical protein